MKHHYTIKLFSAFIFLLITGICHAQFASVGAKWHYGTNEINGFGKSFVTYEITKDTLISGNTYSVVSFADNEGNNSAGVHFYLRKDSMKVYYWYHNAERTLFDYHVLDGDTVMLDVCGMAIDPVTKQVVKDTMLTLPFRYVRSKWQKNVLNTNDSIETFILHETRAGIGTIPLKYTNKLINIEYSSNLALLGLGYYVSIPETSVSFRCYTDNSISFKLSNEACEYVFVGMSEQLLNNNEISIYPNPVGNVLHIKLQKQDNISQVAVYNINGQAVLKQNFNATFAQEAIDVSTLPKGLYHVLLSNNNGPVYMQRFVKE